MSDYTLIPTLSLASIEDYVILFNAAFGGVNKLTSDYLHWQYLGNPNGKVIGYDAFLNGELAAHYAIIPRRYRLGDRSYSAALSVNTATHPRHQGKKLFPRLAELTYAAAEQRGVEFVVGAANANSIDGFVRKLGFQRLGEIRLYVGFRAPENDAKSLMVDADANWLQWRLRNPSRTYTAVRQRDGSVSVRTTVRHLPFNIGRISATDLPEYLASRSHGILVPALAPRFASRPPNTPKLPLMLQPSPWHVIWRSLKTEANDALAGRLCFDGLAMDTF